jgi:two-component system, NarL family, sensor histidine kinase DesK
VKDRPREALTPPVAEGDDAAAVRGRRLPRGGRLFGPLLGLLWLAYPIGALLASDPSFARLVFALGGTALFVGVFLWLIWLREPLLPGVAGASEFRARRAAVLSLVALTLALALVYGNEWFTLFFFTNVAAGLMLPGRDARMAIVGSAVLLVVFGRASGLGWPDIGQAVLATSALGLLFTVFAHNLATVAELRAAREEIARLAVSEERLRFARDLHDLLGHSISLITLKSELAQRLLPAYPERAAREARDIEGVARRALREVREAVADYRQPALRAELAGAREMLEAAGIMCRVEDETGVLPGAADAVLAWAVREGVTNVIRHSRARCCRIGLSQRGEEARVEVSDDGPSPIHSEVAAGSGLSGLSERVAASGGDIEAGLMPGGGFRLRVSLPLREGAPPHVEPAQRAGDERRDGQR